MKAKCGERQLGITKCLTVLWPCSQVPNLQLLQLYRNILMIISKIACLCGRRFYFCAERPRKFPQVFEELTWKIVWADSTIWQLRLETA